MESDSRKLNCRSYDPKDKTLLNVLYAKNVLNQGWSFEYPFMLLEGDLLNMQDRKISGSAPYMVFIVFVIFVPSAVIGLLVSAFCVSFFSLNGIFFYPLGAIISYILAVSIAYWYSKLEFK